MSIKRDFPSRTHMQICGAVCGLLCLMQAGVLYAESVPSILIVASSGCFGTVREDVKSTLAQCAKVGADMVALTVTRADNRALAIASPASGKATQPLSQALSMLSAPRLLLRVKPDMMDEVISEIGAAQASERVLIEPVIERPQGEAAPDDFAPGMRYWRMQRSIARPMMIHVIEVNMETPGLELVVTPGSPHDDKEFLAEKTSEFARRLGLSAAINAGYFRPFDGGRLIANPYIPAIGQPVVVDGVSMHDGHLDSDYAGEDERVNAVLCISKAAVGITQKSCSAETRSAVGAGPLLLLDGVRQPLVGKRVDYYTKPQPRTAVGIDAAGKRIWLVVVDGRQEGYSEGISLPEFTDLFLELGAAAALNLDGGGSSTMAAALDGVPEVVNSPIHTAIPGRERPVANHLGVRINKALN